MNIILVRPTILAFNIFFKNGKNNKKTAATTFLVH